jgi:hypothetical protein
MKFSVQVLIQNGHFQTVGYVDAESKDKAVEKIGLFPTGSVSTGLQAAMGDGSFATISLEGTEESGCEELINRDQVRLAIGRQSSIKFWTPKPVNPGFWERP